MKVLVIDDDDTQRLLMQKLLENKLHAEVVVARDGMEGLMLLHRESPDFAILDVMMPVMDGFEVLKSIRADKKYRTLPVVVISCVDEKPQVLKLIELGVTDYIKKPIQPEPVVKRLTKVMSAIEHGEVMTEKELR